MTREKIKFPTFVAYHQGLALLGDAVPVYVRNEKRRTVAAGKIPSRLRAKALLNWADHRRRRVP